MLLKQVYGYLPKVSSLGILMKSLCLPTKVTAIPTVYCLAALTIIVVMYHESGSQHAVHPAWNSPSSQPFLPRAGKTGIHHHAQILHHLLNQLTPRPKGAGSLLKYLLINTSGMQSYQLHWKCLLKVDMNKPHSVSHLLIRIMA